MVLVGDPSQDAIHVRVVLVLHCDEVRRHCPLDARLLIYSVVSLRVQVATQRLTDLPAVFGPHRKFNFPMRRLVGYLGRLLLESRSLEEPQIASGSLVYAVLFGSQP